MVKLPYVLLAEDSDDDSFFVQRCFAACGTTLKLHRCIDGNGVIKELERCGETPPRAVILDLKMPQMDGFETLKWIREQGAFKSLPVVILTSSSMERDVIRARELGATEYLVKPNSLTELKKIMSGLAQRYTPPSAS